MPNSSSSSLALRVFALISQSLSGRLLHSSRHLFPTPLLQSSISLLPRRHLITAPPMAQDDLLRKALADKLSRIQAQGDAVHGLKASRAPKSDVDAAIQSLNALKLDKASIEAHLQSALVSSSSGDAFRQAVVNTLERSLFYIPSFKIYRGSLVFMITGLQAVPSSPMSSLSGVSILSWRRTCWKLIVRV